MNASNSASWRRFHPLYAFRFFRYGLLVCLIPLARAALSFEFGAFFDALYQDALLLCVFGTASAVLWMSTGFCVRDGALCTRSAIVYKTHHVFRLQNTRSSAPWNSSARFIAGFSARRKLRFILKILRFRRAFLFI